MGDPENTWILSSKHKQMLSERKERGLYVWIPVGLCLVGKMPLTF
jgi:hypothetical protein